MASEAQLIGHELLKTGLAVGFRIVGEEVLTAPTDKAEFGMRLELKFVTADDEDEQDEDEVAEETAEWGALGFLICPRSTFICRCETAKPVGCRL
jgi:hypothetical protein